MGNQYDFNQIINRRNTGSMKWEVADNELPMWVADMDFATAPEITAAIRERAEQGVFGYAIVPEEWYTAIIGWWKRRHGFEFGRDWLSFCTGVVPSISSTVRKLTTANENVVMLTPVYNIFYNSIINNGRRVLESPLVYRDNQYFIDFTDLEEKLSNPQTTLLLLCNPHNPIGKVWDRETLVRIGDLCSKYHVVVVSDEIHCDLTIPGYDYIPFASVSETCRNNSITCISPTKAFNLAGLQTAAIMIPDEYLRHKVNRAINTDEVAEPNVFAITAAIAAFTEGEPWLEELRSYLYENRLFVRDFLEKNLPGIHLVDGQATYLLWLDCTDVLLCSNYESTTELCTRIRQKTGLYLSNGEQYGGNGKHFLRMNIACPRETLKDGLQRLQNGL